MPELCLSMEEVIAMGDAIAETAAIIDVATHRFLTQLREFDRLGAWHRAGAISCAHWLSWRIGLDLGAAREKVRVARRLADLPHIDQALRKGEISYSKVRAISRVATATNEGDLLNMARNTTGAQLAKICRLKRRVDRLQGADPRPIEECRRYVLQHSTDDGMVSVQVRLLPDEAARVMRAFEAFGGGNLADGAVAVAELALAGGTAEAPAAGTCTGSRGGAVPRRTDGGTTWTDGGTTRSPRRPAKRRTVRPPVEVVLHVSSADLEGRTQLGDGISPEVSRRLLCDCGVVPMLENGSGKTIDVGRKKRTIPAALRRALDSRDGGCRFPGCTNLLFTDGHHVKHWINGGETNLANTILLCRRHHRFLHEYGFTVEVIGEGPPPAADGASGAFGEARLVFRDPTGRVISSQGARPVVVCDPAERVRGWVDEPISGETRPAGWDGLQVDYDRCVAALR